MLRRLAALSALLLSLTGCVTTREVVYRDRYYDADGHVRYERDSYRDGSYYAPALSGRGDYYYGRAPYASSQAWYWDYPAYYSVFWPLYRNWYDPFWHPGFYYGVTWFPRHYFSVGWASGWGWPRHGYLYYSPYRYSWVDNYYDWSPGRRHRHHGYQAPRYGSARNEAERLARMGSFGRGEAAAYAHERRAGPSERYGATRDGRRAADYRGQAAPREEPGFRGFGTPAEVRRVGAPRDARVDAYELPGRPARREASYEGGRATPRGAWHGGQATTPAQQELGRWQEGAGTGHRYGRATREPSGYSGALPTPQDMRRGADYGQPAPRYDAEVRRYESPRGAPVRAYDAPASGYAPAPRAEPSWTRSESRSAGGESRPAAGGWGGESRGGSSRGGDQEVRRVGGNRDD